MIDNYTNYVLAEIEEIYSHLTPGTQIAYKAAFESLDPTLAFLSPLFTSDEYYHHHGVYLGNGLVAHIFGQNKAVAKPSCCDIFEFMGYGVDGKVYRVITDDSRSELPVEITLSLAEAALADPSIWPKFHIVSNNCESFAAWLKTGVQRSSQTIEAMDVFLPRYFVGSAAALLASSSLSFTMFVILLVIQAMIVIMMTLTLVVTVVDENRAWRLEKVLGYVLWLRFIQTYSW